MKLHRFKSFGEIKYSDVLQLDGAFSVSHINYREGMLNILGSLSIRRDFLLETGWT